MTKRLDGSPFYTNDKDLAISTLSQGQAIKFCIGNKYLLGSQNSKYSTKFNHLQKM